MRVELQYSEFTCTLYLSPSPWQAYVNLRDDKGREREREGEMERKREKIKGERRNKFNDSIIRKKYKNS